MTTKTETAIRCFQQGETRKAIKILSKFHGFREKPGVQKHTLDKRVFQDDTETE